MNAFPIFDRDNELIRKLKTEADIKLASVDKDNSIEINYLSDLVNLGLYLNSTNHNRTITLLEDYIKFLNTGILSPLTLKDDEFEFTDEDENAKYYVNNRYQYILKSVSEGLGLIENIYKHNNAYICEVVKQYNDITNIENKLTFKYILRDNLNVYITKGGIVTGEYIKDVYINIDKYKEKPFDLTIPILLPVSMILTGSQFNVYTIDHRHAKLKELLETYNVPILIHKTIDHYNIRDYKKLDK